MAYSDICVAVFGKRFSDLTDDDRRVFDQLKRKANHYRHHEENMKRLRETKQERKRALIEAMEWDVACQRCGYNRYIGALDFHHVNPEEKHDSKTVFDGPWDVALAEVQKCQLVCSNCHREAHQFDGDPKRSIGRPRQPDPLLEVYLRASGLPEDAIHHAMKNR